MLVPMTNVPAMRYYHLVMLKESNGIYRGRDPISFCLPYPLDPLLIFPRASHGLPQTHFDMGKEDVFDTI